MDKQVYALSVKNVPLPISTGEKGVSATEYLRDDTDAGAVLQVGVCDMGPKSFLHTFGTDETIYIIEGRMDVTLEDGTIFELATGDLASFRKGSTATLTIREHTREIFVLS